MSVLQAASNGYGHIGVADHENGGALMDSITTSSTVSTTTTYQGIINSMATLSNIGNSCYLNSVVYTLRFTPNFLHNLHHLVDDLHCLNQLQQQHQQQHNQNGMRRANKTSSLGRNQSIHSGNHQQQQQSVAMAGPLSSASSGSRSMSNKDLVAMANGINGHGHGLPNGGGGATTVNGSGGGMVNGGEQYHQQQQQLKCNRQTATEKLHELYQSLTRNENVHHLEPYQPVQFLNAIQDVSTTFEGNQQQDAHEFLMCILDSIRETCQTLAKSFAESNEFQRTLNGVAHMACNDAPTMEPSNLSTAQIIASNRSSSSTSGGGVVGSVAPFKSIFNLKRKSKRKEEKSANAMQATSALPSSTVDSKTNNSGNNSSTKVVPDIMIDPMTTTIPKPTGSPTDDKDTGTATSPGEAKLQNGGEADSEKAAAAEKVPKLESDFFSEDFEGVTVSTTKCLSCETETEQKETMIDIAIPISGHESLESLDNPQAFFQSSCITKEYFRGDNKYRCEKCSAYTEAIRSISFEVLPRLLVVQLKRFSGGMEKINSFIPTPFVLQCFCRKCCARPDDKKLHVYRLYSVITHVGATMSAGHYITYTSALDCYCDYLDCEKEAMAAAAVLMESASSATVTATTTTNGMEYDLTDGKLSGVTNLSNPGHHHQHQGEKIGSNLIDKFKKNRLFKNKSSSSSSSGLRAKFSLGSSSTAAAATTATPPAGSEALMNSHNELIERHLTDTLVGNLKKSAAPQMVGVGGYQPSVCRSLNCCTIKAKASFLLKQVASCGENARVSGSVSGSGGGAADWNLYCNNARHQAKFGGGGTGSSECGDSALDGANLTTSMSSSSSSATSGSLKNQTPHQHHNGGISMNGGGVRLRNNTSAVNVSDEPIWYMCDDEKIKSMPQHEFKELLSSNRKIAITPYLLFYARSDL